MAAMFARRWKIAHPRAVARAMLVIALIVCIFYILVPHSFFIFISGFNDKTQLFHQGLDQRIQTEKVHAFDFYEFIDRENVRTMITLIF